MKKCIPVMFGLVPLAVSASGAALHSVLLMAISVPLLFGMVHSFSFCRKRENLYVFLYSAFTMIPVNILMIRAVNPILFSGESALRVALLSFILFFVFLSVEEIILGVLTRLIWPRQYKLPTLEEDE